MWAALRQHSNIDRWTRHFDCALRRSVLHFQADLASVGMSGTYEPKGHDNAELVVLRHDFARQLVLASYCEGGPWCTCLKGCLGIQRLGRRMKVCWWAGSQHEHVSALTFESDTDYRLTREMQDAMSFLEFIYLSGAKTERVFEGWLEVPESIHRIVSYVERFVESRTPTEAKVIQSKTVAAEMLACIDFPDEYLREALQSTAPDPWDP